jgi:hypothetical protein
MAGGLDNDDLDKPWLGGAALSYLNAANTFDRRVPAENHRVDLGPDLEDAATQKFVRIG